MQLAEGNNTCRSIAQSAKRSDRTTGLLDYGTTGLRTTDHGPRTTDYRTTNSKQTAVGRRQEEAERTEQGAKRREEKAERIRLTLNT